MIEIERITKTQKLANYIGESIRNGQLKEGENLLSEPKLAEQCKVSVVTVRRAIKKLTKEGLIYSIQGKGNIVRRIKKTDWELDINKPYEGKVSLRMRSKEKSWNGFYFYLSPQNDTAKKYVFSVYLKADREGIHYYSERNKKGICSRFNCQDRKEINLTTSWKRYYISGIIPAKVNRYNKFGLWIYGEGTVWADAVQVEEGEEPTEFEP